MFRATIRDLWGAVLCAACCALPAATAASFEGLGTGPAGIGSFAWSVSGNGVAVVGGYYTDSLGHFAPFRWTRPEGIVALGPLPPGHDGGGAIAASADGSVVVGWSGVLGGGASQPFRWTRQTGIVQLGNSGAVSDASDDANVIVGGTITDRGWEPFRWTAETGMVALGCLPGAQRYEAEALAVSGDGSVVVGWSVIAKGWEAFRWTAADGMVALGALPGDVVESGATAVSADASVIMGISGNRLFRWTEATGIVDAGCAPNHSSYIGLFDVSADASVGVGTYGTGDPLGAAFIWDAQHGVRNLQTVLTTEYGLDLTGWNLYEAHDVSADGHTIVGSGLNPTRHYEGWVAVIPEPATVTFALIALLILRPRRR